VGQRDKPTLTTDEIFMGSSVDGMRKHNTIAALAFKKTETYLSWSEQENVNP